MPILKSAKKALRQAIKHKALNDRVRRGLLEAIKTARENPTSQTVQKAYSVVDKAIKTNIIHKNKAARIKSSLAKLISPKDSKPLKTTKKKPVKSSKK